MQNSIVSAHFVAGSSPLNYPAQSSSPESSVSGTSSRYSNSVHTEHTSPDSFNFLNDMASISSSDNNSNHNNKFNNNMNNNHNSIDENSIDPASNIPILSWEDCEKALTGSGDVMGFSNMPSTSHVSNDINNLNANQLNSLQLQYQQQQQHQNHQQQPLYNGFQSFDSFGTVQGFPANYSQPTVNIPASNMYSSTAANPIISNQSPNQQGNNNAFFGDANIQQIRPSGFHHANGGGSVSGMSSQNMPLSNQQQHSVLNSSLANQAAHTDFSPNSSVSPPNLQQSQSQFQQSGSSQANSLSSSSSVTANANNVSETAKPKTSVKRRNSRKSKAKPNAMSNSSDEDLFKLAGSSNITTTNNTTNTTKSNNSTNSGTSSSLAVGDVEEDEELAIKRKAQNRAAQRAFRERKEARVRELEQKLSESEKEQKRLFLENVRLKRENTVISTENQVLLATGYSMVYDQDHDQMLVDEEGNDQSNGNGGLNSHGDMDDHDMEINVTEVHENGGQVNGNGYRVSSPSIKIKSESSDNDEETDSHNSNNTNDDSNSTMSNTNTAPARTLPNVKFISKKPNPALMSQRLVGTIRPNAYNKPLRAVFPVHKFNFELLRSHDVQYNQKTKGSPALTLENASMKEPLYIAYEQIQNPAEMMLGAGAVWELIAGQADYEDVDAAFVMSYLKGKEHCDGFGPVFKRSDVLQGIELARSEANSMEIDDYEDDED